MNIHFSDRPDEKTKHLIIDNLWTHNEAWAPVDIRPFMLSIYNGDMLSGGLVAQTWWGALEIQYLWVAEEERRKGYGRALMLRAEMEARKRGCHMTYVDTFSFQARGFYEKLGYREYGKLDGYARKFSRHYLSKEL
ncbi:putative acetyltransferase [Cedecea neteri]|uniref:N-acetyltransferase n=1 Tax=Cedecea neteri TaxID=158822 RepID=A0A291E605_9ENTR|nr:GNAT family N-acetyltransferase [Cedecea neteri]ATF95494.1 N-acetyltransferase [Cedecea neteri]SQC92070.1 putative acetyltransferase [Cedecea neteri]